MIIIKGKGISLIFIWLFLTACAPESIKGSGSNDRASAAAATVMSQISQTGVSVVLQGTTIANLASSAPVVSSYGTFTRGQALNKFVYQGIEFLIYGEDGVFAAECEPSSTDMTFGPSHPLCDVVHAESYDTVIICFANTQGADVMFAQEWPGADLAFEPSRGMICYKDGVKQDSAHFFTY